MMGARPKGDKKSIFLGDTFFFIIKTWPPGDTWVFFVEQNLNVRCMEQNSVRNKSFALFFYFIYYIKNKIKKETFKK